MASFSSQLIAYPKVPPPPQRSAPTKHYMLNTLKPLLDVFVGVRDPPCIMLVKIAKMIVTTIEAFNDIEHT